MSLSASVGHGGRNLADDVRQVQSLLNEAGAAPALVVDGACGPQTVGAIRWFQEHVVHLPRPDGRVDPGGGTWTALTQRTAVSAEELCELRRRHVDPRVKENATTTRIIEALLPLMQGTTLEIISGWLSDADQAWKVDYHWEQLLWITERSLAPSVDASTKTKLEAIRTALLANPPSPPSGYRTSGVVGQPVDGSSAHALATRYTMLSQQKRAFARVVEEAGLIAKSSDPASAFQLAAATISAPGTSKHGTGYAVDIEGPADVVRSICTRLGATLVLDEQSHTHVEFARGIR
jgi:peptidoglycan hydrolase-like protein with peptidoglycan-binding domain